MFTTTRRWCRNRTARDSKNQRRSTWPCPGLIDLSDENRPVLNCNGRDFGKTHATIVYAFRMNTVHWGWGERACSNFEPTTERYIAFLTRRGFVRENSDRTNTTTDHSRRMDLGGLFSGVHITRYTARAITNEIKRRPTYSTARDVSATRGTAPDCDGRERLPYRVDKSVT